MRRPIIFTILICLVAPLVSIAEEEPVVPRWIDPLGRDPLPFAVWSAENPQRAEGTGVLSGREGTIGGRAAGDLFIVVEDRLSAALDSELTTWYADLATEGWSVDEYVYTGGDAALIRQQIQNSSSDGVILLGQIPVPWFEMDETAWGADIHEEFPCDLYYMDTDGSWADNDGDGILDSHTGDITPELWVSRISAREQTFGQELDLLQNYFVKNHQYRTAGLGVTDRALAYNDDDWAYTGDDYGLSAAYGDVTDFNSDSTTTADHLLDQYALGYEFVHLMSHSSPWGHTFKVPGGYAGSIFNYEIEALLPEAVFVNLFSCSCTRFVEFDNIGNWYIFHDGPGLVSLGSAKTGSMLDHDEFYTPLGTGLSIGEAFEDWCRSNIYSGMSSYYKCWYYGLNILGDATLTLHGASRDDRLTGYQLPAPRSGDFEDWVTVSSSAHSDVAPALVGTSGGAWCAWVSAEHGRSSIYVSELTDGWSTPEALDNATYWEYQPALVRDGSEIHCVFCRFDGDTYDYDLFHSHRDGAVWSTPQKIEELDGYDLHPALCASGDELWLVWQKWTGEGCYLNYSTYDGSWYFSSSVGADGGAEPALCSDGSGGVHLAHQSRGDDQPCAIELRHNGGSGWSSAEALPGTGDDPAHPDLLRGSDGTLWCAFEDAYGDTTAVFVSRYTGGGWQTPERLTDGGLAAHRPRLAEGSDGVICSFWADDGADRYAYLCEYDGGWQAVERLTESGYQGWDPAVAGAGDGRLTVAWQQYDGDDLQIVSASEPQTDIEDVLLGADVVDDGVLVEWSVIGDTPAAVHVLRGETEPVAVSGALSGPIGRWLDRDVEAGDRCVYWVEVADADGSVIRFGPTEVVVPEAGRRLTLLEPYPNPAADSVVVAFELPGSQTVALSVYDLAGRRVASIAEGRLSAGRHEIVWDCSSESSGIYLLRLETKGSVLSRRVVVGR